MAKKTTSNIIIDSPQNSWKRRPSEIRGYHRAMYLTSDAGDYLRVDYNLKEKRVRLYIEIASEGGNSYYAVISNGRITAEKSVSSGRTFGFAEKFRDRSDVFSTIPNNDVLRLIGRNYGISRNKGDKESNAEKQKRLEETRQRYFRIEDSDQSKREEAYAAASRIRFIDFIDIAIGIMLSGSLFLFFQYSFIAMGIMSAFFGIIIGLVDMLIRGRAPIFFKVLMFLLSGTVFYIYGYFI